MRENVIRAAGRALGSTLVRKASRIAREVGFSYEPVAEAPSTYEELRAAFQESIRTRRPLPVWSGACKTSIYGSVEANWAFRFLHDLSHCILDEPFTVAGELQVHSFLARSLGIAQFAQATSCEDHVYWADSYGQSLYSDMTRGKFPEDQTEFAVAVVQRWACEGGGLYGAVKRYAADRGTLPA